MGLSLSHLLLVLLIVFVIFGAGKLPRVMGDIGKGIRNMRDGMKGEEDASKPSPRVTRTIEQPVRPERNDRDSAS